MKEGEPNETKQLQKIKIDSPEFKDLTHLATEPEVLREVIKTREDDAIMAEYVKQGLVKFIGEMSEEEMDKYAHEKGWPYNWDAAHPVYDNNGVHQKRWKIYEIDPKVISTETKIKSGGNLTDEEEKTRKTAELINEEVDNKFSSEDLYFRSAEIQKELLDRLISEGQAEYLGRYGQIEAYDRIQNFQPLKNKKDVRIPTREKTQTGDRIFDYYRIK